MKQRKNPSVYVIFLLVLGTLMACESVPEIISDNLAPNEYFQKAQEEVSRGNYEAGLLYYHTFLERYPQDLQKVVEAEYEIAYIYYKSGNTATAEELFRAIAEKYSQEGAEILPAWPNVLALKLIGQIEKEKQLLQKEKASTEAK